MTTLKKSFILLALMTTSMVYAQDYYVFTDKDGSVIENHATITRTDVEDDGFGIVLNSDLYVKNVAAPDNYQVTVTANITQLDNGAVQLCFPSNCYSYSMVGTYGGEEKTSIAMGNSKSIASEWLPVDYGECVVEYTAMSYQGIFAKDSHTVTVEYRYANPAGVYQVSDGLTTGPRQFYNLLGHRVRAVQRGLGIVRSSDGRVRKYFNK